MVPPQRGFTVLVGGASCPPQESTLVGESSAHPYSIGGLGTSSRWGPNPSGNRAGPTGWMGMRTYLRNTRVVVISLPGAGIEPATVPIGKIGPEREPHRVVLPLDYPAPAKRKA